MKISRLLPPNLSLTNLPFILLFDYTIIMLMYVIALMVLSGYYSLLESKMLAIFQLRMGPNLFLFGITTPLTDGMKLFIKFTLFVINVDIFYIFMSTMMTFMAMYAGWFTLPMGFLMFLDYSFTIFMMLIFHTMTNIMSFMLMGCFLFCNCFMYMATMRIIFFTMLNEASMNILFYIFYMLDMFTYLAIKDINTTQLFIYNAFTMGFTLNLMLMMTMLIDTLRMPWEYSESESELVAGMVTEFSGFFFMIYSLLEMNHILFSGMLISMLIIGGVMLSIKTVMMMMMIFLMPRSIAFSMKMTTTQTFILMMLTILNFMSLLWMIFMKIMTMFL